MVEAGPEIFSRLPQPDVLQRARSIFARSAAIALIGTSAFFSKNARIVAASPIDFSTDTRATYYEPHEMDHGTQLDSHVSPDTYSRVMVCFDAETSDIEKERSEFVADMNSHLQYDEDSSQQTMQDVNFDTDPLLHIPCTTAVVTEQGYSLLESNPATTSLAHDIEIDVADSDRTELSGDLAHYVGSTYAEGHGITGKGQRVGVIGTGVYYQSPYNSYRQALEIRSGCVGTNYVQDSLFSGCPGGVDRVIGDYAGKIFSRDLVSAGHEDGVSQLVHAVAPDAHIVPFALNTIKRQPDGDQLVLFGSDVVRAIDEAIELDVDSVVISLAVSGPAPDNCSNYYPPFNEAQARANAVDMPLFISTGNSSVVSWPACVRQPGVYPITTVDYTSTIPYFAGYQDSRVLAARGEDALIINLYGNKQLTSGTSYAAPVAAALYSLWKSTNLSYSSQETMNLMRRYAGIARAQNGDNVPNLNVENVLRQPHIARRLGFYFTALLPHLVQQP